MTENNNEQPKSGFWVMVRQQEKTVKTLDDILVVLVEIKTMMEEKKKPEYPRVGFDSKGYPVMVLEKPKAKDVQDGSKRVWWNPWTWKVVQTYPESEVG